MFSSQFVLLFWYSTGFFSFLRLKLEALNLSSGSQISQIESFSGWGCSGCKSSYHRQSSVESVSDLWLGFPCSKNVSSFLWLFLLLGGSHSPNPFFCFQSHIILTCTNVPIFWCKSCLYALEIMAGEMRLSQFFFFYNFFASHTHHLFLFTSQHSTLWLEWGKFGQKTQKISEN